MAEITFVEHIGTIIALVLMVVIPVILFVTSFTFQCWLFEFKESRAEKVNRKQELKIEKELCEFF